jgi:leucyl-tRNA synthetase
MAISIDEGFEQSKNKLKVYKTFLQSKAEIKKQKVKNKLDEKKLARQQKSLERAKKNQERKERAQSSYDQLIDILQMAKGAAKPKDNYVTNLLVKVTKQIKPKISEIISEEMLKSLNCSESPVHVDHWSVWARRSKITYDGYSNRPNGRAGESTRTHAQYPSVL